MQLKKFYRRGFQLFASYILDKIEVEIPILADYHVPQEIKDVHPDEVSGIPPNKDIHFRIDLVPLVALVSKKHYKMSTQEILELKIQLQLLLENKYIRKCVSVGRSHIIC